MKNTSGDHSREENGYATQQLSLFEVFVLFFAYDPAQNTIVVYPVLRN